MDLHPAILIRTHLNGLAKLLPVFLMLPLSSAALEISGEAGLEFRAFKNAPVSSQQHNGNFSGYVQPEFHKAWSDIDQSVTFEPFLRIDQHDEERTHFDIRELFWEKVSRDWELRIGLKKVFWGVTESQHLVDIINQTDLVENIDTEDKLGQPMVNLALVRDYGTFNAFLLLGFRERTFPGRDGRPRTPLVVDTDNPIYDDSFKERRIDGAIRWSHYIGDYDFGLAHFSGTSRDPLLIPTLLPNGSVVLRPRYDIIEQTSLDFQATKGSALWKFEGLTRNGQGDRYFAFVGGIEYTLVGLFGRAPDLGLLLELHRDDRNETAPTLFQNDTFVGGRYVLNDMQSTEILAGIVFDNKNGSESALVEASRRLTNNFKLNIEGRAFHSDNTSDPLFNFRKDDYLQIDVIFFY